MQPTDALPLLNRPQFEELTFSDLGLQRELLQVFLEQVPSVLEALQTQTDPGQLRELVHMLKGSSQCVAAERLQEAAHRAEKALVDPARAAEGVAMAREVHALLGQTAVAVQSLDQELATGG